MKNKLLLILVITLAAAVPVLSKDFTREEALTEEYLINHGHSKDMANIVTLQEHQMNNKKYIPPIEKEYYNTQPVKFIRDVMIYLDNGYDDGKFGRHDINPSTRFDDL